MKTLMRLCARIACALIMSATGFAQHYSQTNLVSNTAGVAPVTDPELINPWGVYLNKKLSLSFDILTDLHLKTAGEFRLVFTLPDYLRDLYKSFGNARDRFHDEPEYRLPISARYVIDQQGFIRATDVNADYTIRLEPSETLRRLRALTKDLPAVDLQL